MSLKSKLDCLNFREMSQIWSEEYLLAMHFTCYMNCILKKCFNFIILFSQLVYVKIIPCTIITNAHIMQTNRPVKEDKIIESLSSSLTVFR